VLITLLQSPEIIKHPYRLTAQRTNWLKYKKYVRSHINITPQLNPKNDSEYCADALESVLVAAAKSSTPQEATVRQLVREKQLLRRAWQSSRSPLSKQLFNKATKPADLIKP